MMENLTMNDVNSPQYQIFLDGNGIYWITERITHSNGVVLHRAVHRWKQAYIQCYSDAVRKIETWTGKPYSEY